MIVEERLKELNYELPEMSPPKAMYIPVKQLGNALFVSGQIPMLDGKLLYSGKAGDKCTLEEAQDAAKICALNALAALKAYLGDLDRVKSIVKVQAFVNSVVGFENQHLVVNAASQVLFDAFGEAGRHARTAVGTNQLPMDATVEVELIAEV